MTRISRLLLGGLLLIVLAGCGESTSYWQPHLTATAAHLYLTVQTSPTRTGHENDREYILLSRAADKSGTWEERDRYFGSVTALLSQQEYALIIQRDGTVAKHSIAGEPVIQAAKESYALLAATMFNGAPHALNLKADGLHPLRFDSKTGKWNVAGPVLELIGATYLVKLTVWQGRLLAIWRSRRGSSREPGFTAFYLGEQGWVRFAPLPTPDYHGQFSIISTGNRLIILQDPIGRGDDSAPSTAAADALLMQEFKDGQWRPAASIKPAAGFEVLLGQGVTLAAQRTDLIAVRADLDGVHIFHSPSDATGEWALSTSLLQESQRDFWVNLLLLFFMVILIVLFFVQRLLLRRASQRVTVNSQLLTGLASPLDRALALAVDGLLTLPLPYAFLLASNDLDLYNISVADRAILFAVWLCGLVLYSTLAELWLGRTIGKALMGIHVRNADGGRAGARQIFLRNIFRFVDFFPVPLGAGSMPMPYLIALIFVTFTPKRQRLGDVVGRTVVRRRMSFRKRVIVLASASPRRQVLLESLGLKFTVCIPDLDETVPFGIAPDEAARRLAREKAVKVAESLDGAELVIAADTIVVHGKEILGKPRDEADAYRMLRTLSGSTHRVITGVALIDLGTGQMLNAADETEVVMRGMSDAEIKTYIDSGEAMGKAGAYAIQETGDRFVTDVNGSLSNVIGLPMEMLQSMLHELDA